MAFVLAGYLLVGAVLTGYAVWLHRRRGALLASLEASETADRDVQTSGEVPGARRGSPPEDSS